jgi:preprotein translocase subunit SecA
MHAVGRPVLAGTRSVAASERLGALLEREGLPHRILNARQDQEEAEIVAQAGKRERITVATNMAGRGTDIKLDPDVRDAGGLHVIATERHDARRIDRQLCGRCGRQGDPGTYEIVASLEDEILSLSSKSLVGRLASGFSDLRSAPGRLAGNAFAARAQQMAERRHFRARRELLKLDESLETSLAFSGPGE